jgi:hypothetical protein
MPGSVEVTVTPELDPYVPAQEVRISIAVRDIDDVLADPGTLTLRVIRPDGLELVLTYAAGQIVKDGTGLYHYDLLLAASYAWKVRVEADNPTAAAEAVIPVSESPFTDDLDPLPDPGTGNEGKIARVTGGVWTPYAGSTVKQPLIWTAGGWVAQALDLAAAAAVTGLLAVSHIAPGTNGQVLTTTGGVTAWAAPSALAVAGGGPGEVQYNNGGALDGAAGIKVVAAEASFAYGAAPAGNGTHRHSNLHTVYTRNALNTFDIRVLEMGDDLSIGDLTNGGTTYYDVGPSKAHVVRVGAAVEYQLDSVRFDLKTNYIVHGTNFSTNAILNAENAVVIVGARNVANTGDIEVLKTDNVDKIFVGGPTNTAAVVVSSKTGGFFEVRINNVPEYHLDDTALAMNSNALTGVGYIDFGGTLPASGAMRVKNNIGGFANYRSYAGNTRTLIGLSGDGATFDDLSLGDANATDGNSTLYLSAKTQIIVSIAAGTEYLFNTTSANWQGNSLVNVGFVSVGTNSTSTGWLRGPGSTQVIIAQRNVANTQNIAVLQSDNADGVVLGDNSFTATVFFGVKTGGTHRLQVNGADEYVFSSTSFDLMGNTLLLTGTAPAARLANQTIIEGTDNTVTNRNIIDWGNLGANRLTLGGYSGSITQIGFSSGACQVHLGGNASALIGFFGTSATSKQAATGSRGGNAALGTLLTILDSYGLLTNSTSA